MKDERERSRSRESALRHHRAGERATAAAQYQKLLRDVLDDPDILGLAAIVDLQRGDVAEAERELPGNADPPPCS